MPEDKTAAKNPNADLDQLKVAEEGDTTVDEFNLDKFFGKFDFSEYYKYKGSLTDELDCKEVTWLLISDVKEMSSQQKTKLMDLWKTIPADITGEKKYEFQSGNAR